jgi:DNA topoisomerase-3
MKTIIAEKPSVAREIATLVGAKNRKEGYLEGNGYVVTWAFGHLVSPVMWIYRFRITYLFYSRSNVN